MRGKICALLSADDLRKFGAKVNTALCVIELLVGLNQPLTLKNEVYFDQAILSPSKLGKYTTAFVLFKSNNCKDFEAFAEAVHEIVDFYRTSGEYNYLLKVVTATSETLAVFLETCNVFGFSSTHVVLSKQFEDKSLVTSNDASNVISLFQTRGS